MSKIDIQIDDPDIKSLYVEWNDNDFVFIHEAERNTNASHCVLLDRVSARQVRDALASFLDE